MHFSVTLFTITSGIAQLSPTLQIKTQIANAYMSFYIRHKISVMIQEMAQVNFKSVQVLLI